MGVGEEEVCWVSAPSFLAPGDPGSALSVGFTLRQSPDTITDPWIRLDLKPALPLDLPVM